MSDIVYKTRKQDDKPILHDLHPKLQVPLQMEALESQGGDIPLTDT